MARDELLYERLTESIIGAFYEVYNRLGYGFLEQAYSKALMIELGYKGLEVSREVKVDLYYRGFCIGHHRLDLLVDQKVIVEVKALEAMPKIAMRQCLSYMRATGLQVGLVLNFGAEPQIKRVVSRGASLGPNTEVVFPADGNPDPLSGLEDDNDATGTPA
jgi:GxxExxY protein